jgi:hypothetical protein
MSTNCCQPQHLELGAKYCRWAAAEEEKQKEIKRKMRKMRIKSFRADSSVQ